MLKVISRAILIFIFLLISFSFGKELIIESNYPLPHNNLRDIYRETKNIHLIKKILENSGDFNNVEVISNNKIKVERKLLLKTVYIKGNFSVWRRDILSSAGLIENYPIKLDEIYMIPIRIKHFYIEKGFPFVKVKMKTKIDKNLGIVKIWIDIDENYQYEVEKLNLISDSFLSKNLKEKLIKISQLEEATFSYSSIDDAIDSIERYLKGLGYFDVVVYFLDFEKIKTYPKPFNIIFKNPIKVNLYVDTGTKYIFKFNGCNEEEKKKFLYFVDFSEEGFSQFLLEQLKIKIQNYYKGKNYLDAKVSYKLEKDIKNNRIFIIFSIDKGKRYRIGKIYIKTDEEELKDFLKKIDKNKFTLDNLYGYLEQLKNNLIKEGYLNVKSNITINENREKKIFDINISFFKDKKIILEKIVIKDIPDFKVGIDTPKVYNFAELQELLMEMKDYIKGKGYLDGDVYLDTIPKVKDNKVYITAVYQGKLGEKYKKYKSAVYGTFHTKPKFIVRNLDEGYKYFSQELEDNNINYLYETYLFNSVSSYNFIDRKNKKVLESYYLKEDKRGLLQISIGYNTEEELKLTGLLTLKNLFNYGFETTGYINFSTRRILSRVSFGSRLFPYKISAFTNFYKDYQYHRLFDKDIEGYGIWGERYINKWVKRSIDIERNYIQIKNTDFNLGRYERYFITKIRYTITDNHKNSRIFPTGGYYFTGSLTKYFEDLSYFKLDTYFRYYYPVLKRVVWTQALSLGYIWENIENIPISERYFIGRTEGFRGFGFEALAGNNEKGGKSFFVLNNEIRFPIFSNAIYGFVFIDIGNTFEDDRELKKLKTRETGGLGVLIPTPAGAILLDVAKKLDKRKGESPYRLELSIELRF